MRRPREGGALLSRRSAQSWEKKRHRSHSEEALYDSMIASGHNGLIVSPGGSKAGGEWLVALTELIADSQRSLAHQSVDGLFLDAQAASDSGAADAIAEHALSVLKELNGIKSLFTVGVLNYPIGRSDPSKIAATIAEVARALESKTSSVIKYRRLFWGFRFSADPEVAEAEASCLAEIQAMLTGAVPDFTPPDLVERELKLLVSLDGTTDQADRPLVEAAKLQGSVSFPSLNDCASLGNLASHVESVETAIHDLRQQNGIQVNNSEDRELLIVTDASSPPGDLAPPALGSTAWKTLKPHGLTWWLTDFGIQAGDHIRNVRKRFKEYP